ncbi:glycosyltransferase family 39 protein [Methanococcoides methylutens]|uniref:Uncharacterized protein n=1 Tax=Methanococcoides methylutens MM1 TaxID=1434104 RepID=A0A0E3STL3_METMT|nr:glycosyltransferase family 39 protein [Methanococcoides methylutens]AKB86158.1 hypothetical protein MCMEM_2105 [Methanococcoides methylutens MM1]
MSSNLAFNKETIETLTIEISRLPTYIDFYIGIEKLLCFLFISAYIYGFFYIRDRNKTDAIHTKRSKKLINYVLYALICSAIFYYIPYFISSSAALPIVTATFALGLTILYLQRSEKRLSYTLHPKWIRRSYVIDHEKIYELISFLFYGLLLLSILNMMVHPYSSESVSSQATKVIISFGIFSIYINRKQVWNHLQTIQETDPNDFRFKNVGTFAIYLSRELLIPLVQSTREFDRTNPRHERINSIISHTFMGLLLVIAIQSNSSLLLPERLKTPITLATFILGVTSYYLKRVRPISPLMHEMDNEGKQEFIYERFDDTITYASYLLLTFTLLYHLPWSLGDLKTEIIIAAILFGALTFYLNREELKRIEERICQEKLDEKKREKEFAKKYPRINQVWGMRWIGIEIYKEGWLYSGTLISIVLIAFIIRIWNLTILDPYTDEYIHLVAANNLIEMGETSYTRAFLVTHLVKIFFIIGNATSFYEYLFWGRVPGVIFGALTIIPLYYLAKRINKPVAVISGILFAISPWAIGVSRNIREYTYYLFFILIACLILIKMLEYSYDNSKKNTFKLGIYSFVLIGFLYYSSKIDYLSSLKISFLIYPVILFYFLLFNYQKVLTNINFNKKIYYVYLIICLLFGAFLLDFIINNFQVLFGNVEKTELWFNYFFKSSGSPMQWWSDSVFTYIAYLVFSIGFICALYTKKREYFMHFLIFSAFIIFFVFFFNRYASPRYIFYALPFFCILISMSIYSLINLKKVFSKSYSKIAYIVVLFLIISSIFNINNTIYPITSDKHGYVKMTGEHHDKAKDTILFLENEIQEEDVFITTIFGPVIQLAFDININEENNHQYIYRDSERFDRVEEFMENNSQGLMILDWRRNGYWVNGYPKEGEFKVGNITVKTLQNKDGIQVYRWKHEWN